MMNVKVSMISVISSAGLLGLLCSGSVWAGSGVVKGPPENVSSAKTIDCDRTTCYIVSAAKVQPNAPTPVFATDPSDVGPPAGQRYAWKISPLPAPQCNEIPTPAVIYAPSAAIGPLALGAQYDYIISKPIPVPLGSTHVTVSANAEAKLAGSGSSTATIFGWLRLRRLADGINPTGPWINSDRGYILSTTGTPDNTIRYGKGTFLGLEDLSKLPGGTTVPTLIEMKLVVNAYYDTGWTFSEPPQICKGSMQLTF